MSGRQRYRGGVGAGGIDTGAGVMVHIQLGQSPASYMMLTIAWDLEAFLPGFPA